MVLDQRPTARATRIADLKPLPPGTRVKAKISGRIGTVQHYHPKWNRSGGVPVRFNDQLWEICGAGDVEIIPDTD